MVAAYSILWLVLFFYVFLLIQKQSSISREIKGLQQEMIRRKLR